MNMVKMKAPKNCGGFSAGGEQYKIDKNGFAKIKQEHVDGALRHGFTHVEGEVEADDQVDLPDLKKSGGEVEKA
jgi:hypothetical protein